jgi:hypothetical protein
MIQVILIENPEGDTIEVVGVTELFLREAGSNSCHFAFYMKALCTVTYS